MSRLLGLLEVRPAGGDVWLGPGSGPAGKRAFGGQLAGQALAAAVRTVAGMAPTNMHVQFLRGGDAGDAVEYAVERVFDGRTSACRRVVARQAGRLLTTTTVTFAVALDGPEHGRVAAPAPPGDLPRTGPAGPAPSMPLDEIDIRITDTGCGEAFTRQFWWRTTVPLPDDPFVHTCVAVYVTDVYMIDPALRVHGHAMADRSHRSGTTASSVWFHQPVHSDRWNLLESSSPAAARGRGVVSGRLIDTDGAVLATLVQEGLIAAR
ncbi:acyl-CoA thioesterase domain-containing protein [Mycobacterium talmoniae]|uniref:Acyl-CoA thioesterase II n=1 Tax=Mycobacterium talmoniae TaxID=1858794 RepID=A0A1S1NKM4_9MYCO|nr:acyl-CoA thioesterase domain-containing protein [Mycobacterium talmoniae]OHV06793.1 acyl-CoA thioesterase II [Mycobacterium talmoniae]